MTRLRLLWLKVRSSLWLLPSMLTAAAVALAFVTIRIDASGLLSGREAWFLFGAGAEGARGVLGTIAGSIITVTGVVFSITIVVLQLASSQFTPRVLQSFTEDRPNQLVLGVFIGTFTYALLILRTVRSEADDYDRFVPALSVTVALLLALVSIGFLIFFINHVARSIQAEVVLQRAASNARRVIERLFPQELGEPVGGAAQSEYDGTGPVVFGRVASAGYLQAIDEDRILELCERHDVVVRMECCVGDFLLDEDPVFSVQPASASDELVGDLVRCASMGPDRTRHQDLDRSLLELTDIGVRALSPSINDPTTAIGAVDRLTEVISLLASRDFPPLLRKGQDGRVRFVARRRAFADVVASAYASLAHHAEREPAVRARLEWSLRTLLERVPSSRRVVFELQLGKLDPIAAPGQSKPA